MIEHQDELTALRAERDGLASERDKWKTACKAWEENSLEGNHEHISQITQMQREYSAMKEDRDSLAAQLAAATAREAVMVGALQVEKKWHDDCWEGYLEGARQAVAEGNKVDERQYMHRSAVHGKHSEAIHKALSTLTPAAKALLDVVKWARAVDASHQLGQAAACGDADKLHDALDALAALGEP